MNVLVVFDHPRRNSLTGAITDAFLSGLTEAGHTADLADLHREGFDPRMPVGDEPVWGDYTKVYSDEVRHHQARADAAQAMAFIFPVWWWSFPAMTKGYIERVWNHGWANPRSQTKLKHEKALILGVAADPAESFERHGYTRSMQNQIEYGIVNYCGIDSSDFVLLHDSLKSDEHRATMIERARAIGRAF